jgi:hypothetical protein
LGVGPTLFFSWLESVAAAISIPPRAYFALPNIMSKAMVVWEGQCCGCSMEVSSHVVNDGKVDVALQIVIGVRTKKISPRVKI